MTQSTPNETIGWLYFDYVDKSDSGKTEVLDICHKDDHLNILGVIRWNAKWRQYWAEFQDVGMPAGCLEDAAKFIRKLMEIHKS